MTCSNTVLILEPLFERVDGRMMHTGRMREVEQRCGTLDWAGRLVICPLCSGKWDDMPVRDRL